MPVVLQLSTMLGRPLPNESGSCSGCKVPLNHIAVEIKYTPLPLILRMEVWRRMIIIEHAYDDPEKHGNIWHKFFGFSAGSANRRQFEPPAPAHLRRRSEGVVLGLGQVGVRLQQRKGRLPGLLQAGAMMQDIADA